MRKKEKVKKVKMSVYGETEKVRTVILLRESVERDRSDVRNLIEKCLLLDPTERCRGRLFSESTRATRVWVGVGW